MQHRPIDQESIMLQQNTINVNGLKGGKGMTTKIIQVFALVLPSLCAGTTSANDKGQTSKEHNPAPVRFADVQLATGVRLHYAEQGDPQGHPIILLHGYTDSWFSYSRVLPLLPTRYRAYALDQRGHG